MKYPSTTTPNHLLGLGLNQSWDTISGSSVDVCKLGNSKNEEMVVNAEIYDQCFLDIYYLHS